VFIGPLIDRFGSRAVAVLGNVVSAFGFLAFLLVDSAWQIGVVVAVVNVGATMFWTSSSALVALASSPTDRVRWFGFIRGLRNAGVGIGGAIGALIVGLGGDDGGLRAVVIVNAITFALSAWLLSIWRPAGQPAQNGSAANSDELSPPTRQISYAAVLRDGGYLRLVLANVLLVLAAMVPAVLLAIYISDGLGINAAVAGLLLVLNTVLVAAFQTPASRLIEKVRPPVMVAIACALNAVAFGCFAVLGHAPSGYVIVGLVVAVVIYTASEIAAAPSVSELSVAMAPPPGLGQGRYLATFQLSWTVGGALAPWVLTALFSRDPALPWLLLLAISIVGIPLALTLRSAKSVTEGTA
jgi:MFS family permease